MLDGSEPLRDADLERLSGLLMAGLAQLRAFEVCFAHLPPSTSATGLRQKAWRYCNKSEVLERVEFLKKEKILAEARKRKPRAKPGPTPEPVAEPEVVPLDRAGLQKVMGIVTMALSRAATELEKVGGRKAQVARLRNVLLAHAGRLARQAPVHDKTKATDVDFTLMLERGRNMLCRCAVGGGRWSS